MPIRISARPGESSDKVVQRFKRLCSKRGVLKEIKKRRFYEKPSERRRRKAKERQKAVRKKMAKLTKSNRVRRRGSAL